MVWFRAGTVVILIIFIIIIISSSLDDIIFTLLFLLSLFVSSPFPLSLRFSIFFPPCSRSHTLFCLNTSPDSTHHYHHSVGKKRKNEWPAFTVVLTITLQPSYLRSSSSPSTQHPQLFSSLYYHHHHHHRHHNHHPICL